MARVPNPGFTVHRLNTPKFRKVYSPLQNVLDTVSIIWGPDLFYILYYVEYGWSGHGHGAWAGFHFQAQVMPRAFCIPLLTKSIFPSMSRGLSLLGAHKLAPLKCGGDEYSDMWTCGDMWCFVGGPEGLKT